MAGFDSLFGISLLNLRIPQQFTPYRKEDDPATDEKNAKERKAKESETKQRIEVD